jgi:hypothetical protein
MAITNFFTIQPKVRREYNNAKMGQLRLHLQRKIMDIMLIVPLRERQYT